jgi:hypothetical protein
MAGAYFGKENPAVRKVFTAFQLCLCSTIFIILSLPQQKLMDPTRRRLDRPAGAFFISSLYGFSAASEKTVQASSTVRTWRGDADGSLEKVVLCGLLSDCAGARFDVGKH